MTNSDHIPNLVRTLSLDPEYIRKNLHLVNSQVKLLFEQDPLEMTRNWSSTEVQEQRRLVKFDFQRINATDYLVRFNPIQRDRFYPGDTVILCIFWKERDLYIVTSVDIILLLEHLIRETFSIEEKNRIRRNLQSLKPYTISRTNKNYNRFFELLMAMENPRPRNIEKDIKVFKWTDLTEALPKVISKYSSNAYSLANTKLQTNVEEADSTDSLSSTESGYAITSSEDQFTGSLKESADGGSVVGESAKSTLFSKALSRTAFTNPSEISGQKEQNKPVHTGEYYQYPENSQLHYKSNETSKDIKLPSLEEYFNKTKYNEDTKLPPIFNNSKVSKPKKKQ